MVEEGTFGSTKRSVRRGRVSLTQYLESQEGQDMTRLLYFTRTQEMRRNEGFLCFGMEEGGVYIIVVEKV